MRVALILEKILAALREKGVSHDIQQLVTELYRESYREGYADGKSDGENGDEVTDDKFY